MSNRGLLLQDAIVFPPVCCVSRNFGYALPDQYRPRALNITQRTAAAISCSTVMQHTGTSVHAASTVTVSQTTFSSVLGYQIRQTTREH